MAAQPKFGYPGIRRSYTCAEAIGAGITSGNPANSGAGVVVERRSGTDLIGNAAAGSLVVVGVAIDDVPASAAYVGGKYVGLGHEMTVFSGGFVQVVFAATTTEGQRLIAAANGQVTPAGASPDARTIIGHADSAVAAGAVGIMYIAAGGVG